MPRLVGQKNNPALYAVLSLLIVVIGAIALEYFGAVNYIPGFGKEAQIENNSNVEPLQNN